MNKWTMGEAEGWGGGRPFIRSHVKAGDVIVNRHGDELATVTQEALDCDCGKGLLCPAMIQKPILR